MARVPVGGERKQTVDVTRAQELKKSLKYLSSKDTLMTGAGISRANKGGNEIEKSVTGAKKKTENRVFLRCVGPAGRMTYKKKKEETSGREEETEFKVKKPFQLNSRSGQQD